ncbi:ATP-binding protein, partial [Rhodococcus erythropolis]|nr:ATP-binding protein [Rhodococcus erythropolis]
IDGISEIAVTATVAPVRVSGDPRALARMVRNLVDNAVRHAETLVHLECSEASHEAHIVIEDDGPGIPAA